MKIFYIRKDGEINKEIWKIVFKGEYHIIVIYDPVPGSDFYDFTILVAPAVDEALKIKEAFTQFEALPSEQAWRFQVWQNLLRWEVRSRLAELRENLRTTLPQSKECGEIPGEPPDK